MVISLVVFFGDFLVVCERVIGDSAPPSWWFPVVVLVIPLAIPLVIHQAICRDGKTCLHAAGPLAAVRE